MKEKQTSEDVKKTEEFFKEAFCVDGKVKMVTGNALNFSIKSVMELNDSKRGKFYIAHVEKL